MRGRHKVLAVLVVVLLVTAAFAIGMRIGDRGETPLARGPDTTAPPDGPGEGAAPPLGSGVPGAAPGTATFTTTARSLVIDRATLSAESVSLRPRGDEHTLRLGAPRVRDGSGRNLGTGTVEVAGLATVRGNLTITGVVTVTSSLVSLGRDESDHVELQAADVATVDGASLMFKPQSEDGDVGPATRVTGPLRVEGAGVMTITGGTEWTTPPPEATATSRGRVTVSWAGNGEVKLRDGRTISSGFGGVKGNDLRMTFRRDGGGVVVNGEVQPQQVYADGLPQLTASAAVSIKRAPAPVRSGGGGDFTWAPFNGGATDMVMTRIRPGNELARSINLALETLPPMCGTEECPFGKLGGDTSGLSNRGGFFGGGASPINAVILPGTGDERRISFDLPDGLAPGNHEMVVVLEGNFEPVTVRIPLTVTG